MDFGGIGAATFVAGIVFLTFDCSITAVIIAALILGAVHSMIHTGTTSSSNKP